MRFQSWLGSFLKLNSDSHDNNGSGAHAHHFPLTEGYELAEYILGESIVETFYAAKPGEADEIVAKLLRFQKAMDSSADAMKNYYETHKENDQWLHDLDGALQKIDQGLLPDHTHDHDTLVTDAAASVNVALSGTDPFSINPYLELDQQTTAWSQSYGLNAEQLARVIYFRHDHQLTQQDMTALFAAIRNSGGNLSSRYDFAISKIQEQLQTTDQISNDYHLNPSKTTIVRTMLLNSPDMTEQNVRSLIDAHPADWFSAVEVLSGLIEYSFTIQDKIQIANFVTTNKSWSADFIRQNFQGTEFVTAINLFSKVVSDLNLNGEDNVKLGTFFKNNPQANETEMKSYMQSLHRDEGPVNTADIVNAAPVRTAHALSAISETESGTAGITVVTPANGRAASESLARVFHLSTADEELLAHWMTINPGLTENVLREQLTINQSEFTSALHRLTEAREFSSTHHLSDANTLHVERILFGDRDIAIADLDLMLQSARLDFTLARIDGAINIRSSLHLNQDDYRLVKMAMTAFDDVNEAYIRSLISSDSNGWQAKLAAALSRLSKAAEGESSAPVSARTEWHYAKSWSDFAKDYESDPRYWVELGEEGGTTGGLRKF